MKKTLLASVALLSLGTASGNAADLPVKAPPMAAPIAAYNWTGLYLGAHVGGAFPGT